MNEKDPNGRNPHEPGAKLDAGKSPVFQGVLDYFPRAVKAVANVSAFGASKYAWKGWETVPDGINRYSNAMGRHITDEAIEGPITHDSGLLHKAHIAWNALAALELYIREQEKRELKRNVGTAAAGVGAIAQCISESSAKNQATDSGCYVQPTESSRGSWGASGLSGKVPEEGYPTGGWLRDKGVG